MVFRMGRILCAFFVLAVSSVAQVPEKFTNLQYFPKDISKKDLVSTMRGFSFSLGVRCEFCHLQTADKKTDFASDTKEEKRTARAMLRMVDGINKDYMAKLGKTSVVQVQCVTCHRAISRPVPINALLAGTIEKKDIDSAIAEYKDLRKKYYGGASYDFTETPLNQLAESLMAKDKNKEAVAIMEMNVELNGPPSNWANNVLAMSHRANGETEKAKADFQKIVAAQPDNKWAKEQLEELNRTVK